MYKLKQYINEKVTDNVRTRSIYITTETNNTRPCPITQDFVQ